MDEGQIEAREQPAPAAAPSPADVNPDQQTSPTSDMPTAVVSDVPQQSAPPRTADAAPNTGVNGVVTVDTQAASSTETAQAANPSSQVQTGTDSTPNPPAPEQTQSPNRGESQLESKEPSSVQGDAHAQPGNSKSPGAGTLDAPQLPSEPTGTQQETPVRPPQQPQQQEQQPHYPQHPRPEQHHLQPQHAPPVHTPAAAASAPALPPPPPLPAPHQHQGARHVQLQPLTQPPPAPVPQPHSHPHQYPPHAPPHPPPAPAPQHQHELHLQQPAPPSQTHAQIPAQYHQHPPQHQQQHQHQHQHHQHQHYQHHHQQPQPPSTPVTPVTPVQHFHQFHSHPQPQPQPPIQPPPQPQPVLRSHAPPPPPQHHASLSRPVIMDPPGARKAAAAQSAQQSMGFPSPTRDYATINPKFVDDCTRMNFAIQQSLPEAVRRIVRDHWEKCLLGSEFHQAFILNASIHHALPSITQRAVRDFGSKMVTESKHELMAHFSTEALDEVADVIISKASDSFLDKCLEKRLLTIEAKPLINALAKAERLGYEPGDVVQDGQNERVIPQEAYPGAAPATNGHHVRQSQPSQPSPAYPQSSPTQLQCMKCFRTFVHASAFDHHTRYNICSQLPPTSSGFAYSCPHCGQGATTTVELEGHLVSNVCGHFNQPQKVSRGPGRPPKAAAHHAGQTTIIPPASQPPASNGISRTAPQSTPAHPSVSRAAATPGSTGSNNPVDPYAHLSPQQMQSMNDELKAAEEKYAPKFAEANLIPDEHIRKLRLEGLRNSFGTKQSMVRKKYGVRLRERRTKAEIMAERARLGLQKAEKEKPKAGTSTGAQPQTSSPLTTVSRPAGGTGWTAANTPRTNATWGEHDAKRRRTDEGGSYQTSYKSLADDTPTRKPLSVSEIGGSLSGSAATAATHDPTLPPASQPTKVYEQAGARVEVHEPSRTGQSAGGAATTATVSGSATPVSSDQAADSHSRHPSTQAPAPAARQPLVIDNDSSSDDDDEDIPSTLPTHVRKSLSGSTSLLQTTP